MSWLKYKHPYFAANEARWSLCSTFYTGEESGIRAHLLQHKQGESQTSFEERAELSQFVPYLATTLDLLAGVLMARENEIERHWGSLGDPDTPGTTAYHLRRDADGQGTNWDTMLRRAAIDALLYQDLWGLVDRPADGLEARIHIIPPTAVPNWYENTYGLESVLLKETTDLRVSIFDEPRQVDQYVLYEAAGYARYREENGKEVLVDSGFYHPQRTYVDRSGRPVPPIFHIQLPFRRYIAHQLALTAKILFNVESERDQLLRAAAFPKLVISGDDDFFERQVAGLKKGSNVLQRLESFGDHAFISPDTAGIEAASAVLKEKQAAYFKLAFDLLDLEGRSLKTATQVVAERSNGLAACLALLAAAMEDLESQLLWLLEQCYSDQPSAWTSTVTWPSDYADVTMGQPA